MLDVNVTIPRALVEEGVDLLRRAVRILEAHFPLPEGYLTPPPPPPQGSAAVSVVSSEKLAQLEQVEEFLLGRGELVDNEKVGNEWERLYGNAD